MARSLVRFVFPQFAFRLILVVLAMAIGIVAFARSYRIETLMSRLEREALVLESALIVASGTSHADSLGRLAAVAEATGMKIALFDERGNTLFSSEDPLPAVIVRRLRESQEEPVRIRPAVGGGDLLAIVLPVEIESLPSVSHLGVISDFAGLEQELSSFGGWLVVVLVATMVVVLVVSYRVVDGINAPLKHLQLAASRFAEGDLDYRCLLPEPLEFNRLAETMNSMAAQLTARIQAIAGQRRQLEAILTGMVEGVILVDAQYRVQSMNPAAKRLFQLDDTNNAAGEPRMLLEAIRNSDLYALVRMVMNDGNTHERDIIVYTTPPRYMQVNGTRMRIGNEPHVLLVLNDITRLHELEQVRKEFVANVSHELKTPITSVMGFVETLRDGAIDSREDTLRFLDIIGVQTQRLNAIIEDLLQLSRLEQNRETIQLEEAAPADIIARVRHNVEPRRAEKGIVIQDHYRGSYDLQVSPTLMEQALTNLVDNAIKYCPKESVVDIDVEVSRDKASIAVRDNGPGIPRADQPRIFERFFRVDRARSRTLGGTGLGLAIVKHIVQAHHGSVWVVSSPGAGSTFVITLPQHRTRV